jgi:hypothetical protein
LGKAPASNHKGIPIDLGGLLSPVTGRQSPVTGWAIPDLHFPPLAIDAQNHGLTTGDW